MLVSHNDEDLPFMVLKTLRWPNAPSSIDIENSLFVMLRCVNSWEGYDTTYHHCDMVLIYLWISIQYIIWIKWTWNTFVQLVPLLEITLFARVVYYLKKVMKPTSFGINKSMEIFFLEILNIFIEIFRLSESWVFADVNEESLESFEASKFWYKINGNIVKKYKFWTWFLESHFGMCKFQMRGRVD